MVSHSKIDQVLTSCDQFPDIMEQYCQSWKLINCQIDQYNAVEKTKLAHPRHGKSQHVCCLVTFYVMAKSCVSFIIVYENMQSYS